MISIVKQDFTGTRVSADLGFVFPTSPIERKFEVGDRVKFLDYCFGERRTATGILVQSYFSVPACDLAERPSKGKCKGQYLQSPNGLIAEYEVVLPAIAQIDLSYHSAYPKDGIFRGRLVVNEWARKNFQLITAAPQQPAPGTLVRVCKAEIGLEDDLDRQGTVQPASVVPELQGEVRVLLQGDTCVRRFDLNQLEVVNAKSEMAEPFLLESQEFAQAEPIKVGDRVRVIGETPEGYVFGNVGTVRQVRVEDWQSRKRTASVELDNPTGGVAIQASLPLSAIEKIEKPPVIFNYPEPILTEAQRQAIAAWEAQGWTVTQQPEHEHRMPSEMAIQISRQDDSSKGTLTIERVLFIAGDGWTNTEQQRQTIMSWYNDGWTVTQRAAQHGLPLEIEVELSKAVELPYGELRQLYLLSSIGWACLLSQPADGAYCRWPKVEPVTPELTVIEGAPLERRRQALLIQRRHVEADLIELKAEQAVAVRAGGMVWPKEWASAGIEDYTVVKKLQKTGFYTKFWYHRLYAPTKLFAAKRTTKDDSGKTNRHHLTKVEYARYRAAKYRYDRIQALESQLDQASQAIADIERGKQHRKPSAEGKVEGQWEIWDTRNTYAPGSYPSKTFAFIVYQWVFKNGRLQCRSQKRFGEIPVDEPAAIERAHARAEQWLEKNGN
ncbi:MULTISPECIES: hypothetical protein [Trichocoleus]|uniref:KOW domain-containing protein n=1 Tax=Trichocoleus desertorum GB2-A4 TaxID=2933944 RepID=A0ABV0JE21_9CYAN|nr:hypothetical protein [Trichocoleus sp. FACHB-46]MBD1864195.1 hypothetical protein [Trichocoleus sp. FACHB-46]